jgi:hypothetical protein
VVKRRVFLTYYSKCCIYHQLWCKSNFPHLSLPNQTKTHAILRPLAVLLTLWQNECVDGNYMFVILLHSLPLRLHFHIQNTNSTTKCISVVCLWTDLWRAVAVAPSNTPHCIICCSAVIRTDGYFRLYRLTAAHIALCCSARLEIEPTKYNLPYKEPLTFCYQFVTHFGKLRHYQGTSSNCSSLYIIIWAP